MIFERAKEKADLLSIARGAGLSPKKAGPGRYVICCPVHQEKTPSCFLNTGGKYAGRVKCFGCGWHGSAVDLYAALHGVSAKEAAQTLAGPDPGPQGDLPRPQRRPQPQPDPGPPAGQFSELYAAFLAWAKAYGPSPQKYAVMKYLLGRGIDAAAIRAGGLAAVPDDAAAAAWLKDQPQAQAAGLLSSGGRFALADWPLLLPSLSPDGRVMALQGRRIDDEAQEKKPKKERPSKYKFLAGVARYPYGGQSLVFSGPVYLTEGALDAMALAVLNQKPALGLGGTNLPQAVLGLLQSSKRAAVLTMDNDPAGEAARATLSDQLTAAGIPTVQGKVKGGLKDTGKAFEATARGKLAKMQAKNPAVTTLIGRFGLTLENE